MEVKNETISLCNLNKGDMIKIWLWGKYKKFVFTTVLEHDKEKRVLNLSCFDIPLEYEGNSFKNGSIEFFGKTN